MFTNVSLQARGQNNIYLAHMDLSHEVSISCLSEVLITAGDIQRNSTTEIKTIFVSKETTMNIGSNLERSPLSRRLRGVVKHNKRNVFIGLTNNIS